MPNQPMQAVQPAQAPVRSGDSTPTPTFDQNATMDLLSQSLARTNEAQSSFLQMLPGVTATIASEIDKKQSENSVALLQAEQIFQDLDRHGAQMEKIAANPFSELIGLINPDYNAEVVKARMSNDASKFTQLNQRMALMDKQHDLQIEEAAKSVEIAQLGLQTMAQGSASIASNMQARAGVMAQSETEVLDAASQFTKVQLQGILKSGNYTAVHPYADFGSIKAKISEMETAELAAATAQRQWQKANHEATDASRQSAEEATNKWLMSLSPNDFSTLQQEVQMWEASGNAFVPYVVPGTQVPVSRHQLNLAGVEREKAQTDMTAAQAAKMQKQVESEAALELQQQKLQSTAASLTLGDPARTPPALVAYQKQLANLNDMRKRQTAIGRSTDVVDANIRELSTKADKYVNDTLADQYGNDKSRLAAHKQYISGNGVINSSASSAVLLADTLGSGSSVNEVPGIAAGIDKLNEFVAGKIPDITSSFDFTSENMTIDMGGKKVTPAEAYETVVTKLSADEKGEAARASLDSTMYNTTVDTLRRMAVSNPAYAELVSSDGLLPGHTHGMPFTPANMYAAMAEKEKQTGVPIFRAFYKELASKQTRARVNAELQNPRTPAGAAANYYLFRNNPAAAWEKYLQQVPTNYNTVNAGSAGFAGSPAAKLLGAATAVGGVGSALNSPIAGALPAVLPLGAGIATGIGVAQSEIGQQAIQSEIAGAVRKFFGQPE